MRVSILIPVYNELKTLPLILKRVESVNLNNLEKEIILIDDGSIDGSCEFLKKLPSHFKKIFHQKNQGKGAAIKSGLREATGEIILVQDADLEYEPNDYPVLLRPILDRKAEVVYGSRRLLKSNRQHSSFSFYLGGVLLSFLTSLLYGTRITDEPTGYKVFKSRVLRAIKIESDGFDWEPEVTAKILKRGIKIKEVPIRYYPRPPKEGKKINWRDGVSAIWTLFKYRLRD